jgi:hypothetical protein
VRLCSQANRAVLENGKNASGGLSDWREREMIGDQ